VTSTTLRSIALAGALAMVLAGGPAWGQERSDTGRRKPTPPPPPPPEPVKVVAPEPAERAEPSRWSLGLGAGVVGGGSLFRVETVSGAAVPWGPEDSPLFTSARFRARLDTDLGFAAHVRRQMSATWSLRGDLSYTKMDVAAEALQGQTAAVFLYDRLAVTSLGLGAEARLSSTPSFPLLTAAFLVASCAADRETELDQTSLGLRLGLGYQMALPGKADLRLEFGLSRLGFDSSGIDPDVARDEEPEITVDAETAVNLFDVSLRFTIAL
jgi:hypothetical protein